MNPIFFFNREITPIRKLLMLHLATGGSLIEADAEGNPLTFLTDLARPLKSVLATWQPHQSGTGDPSPENIRPVLGMDWVNVWQYGSENYASGIVALSNTTKNGNVFENTVADSKTFFHCVVQIFNGSTFIKNVADTAIRNVGVAQVPVNIDTAEYTRIVVKHSGSQRDFFLAIPIDGETGQFTLSMNVLSDDPTTIGGLKLSTIVMTKGNGTSYSVEFPVLGKNLFKLTGTSRTQEGVTWTVDGDTLIASGTATGYSAFDCGNVDVEGQCDIRVSGLQGATNIIWSCTLKDANGTTIANVGQWYTDFTIDVSQYPGAKTLSIQVKRNNNAEVSGTIRIQVEKGTTTTPYEPYTRTCYGGTLDLTTGVLTAEYGMYTFTGSASDNLQYIQESASGGKTRHIFNTDVIDRIVKNSSTSEAYSNIAMGTTLSSSSDCRFYIGLPTRQVILQIEESLCEASVESFSAWLSEHPWQLAYPLATPQTYQLSPTQITALIGNNTMWADADELSVTYLKKG